MNLHLLSADQLLQLYDKLKQVTASPKALTTIQLEYVYECN